VLPPDWPIFDIENQHGDQCQTANPAAVGQLEEIKQHLSGTWFAWMGGFGDNDVFYYKVHSPVLLVEFDMHKGVFLNNDEPEKFHIHIMVRTPNGNDYGIDLLRLHYEQAAHHRHK
jgi:hypothetical protein